MQLLKASKRGKLPIVNAAGELLALATRALFREDARMPLGGGCCWLPACLPSLWLPPGCCLVAWLLAACARGCGCKMGGGWLQARYCQDLPLRPPQTASLSTLAARPSLLCRPRLRGPRRPPAGGRCRGHTGG